MSMVQQRAFFSAYLSSLVTEREKEETSMPHLAVKEEKDGASKNQHFRVDVMKKKKIGDRTSLMLA